MGFWDSILGKTKLPEAKTDRLFAISTAAVTLEAKLGLKPGGSAGVCIKPMESSRYEAARAEIEDLLKLSFKETGTVYSIQKDEYNYIWAILNDPDFDRFGDQYPNDLPDPDGAGFRNPAPGSSLPLPRRWDSLLYIQLQAGVLLSFCAARRPKRHISGIQVEIADGKGASPGKG